MFREAIPDTICHHTVAKTSSQKAAWIYFRTLTAFVLHYYTEKASYNGLCGMNNRMWERLWRCGSGRAKDKSGGIKWEGNSGWRGVAQQQSLAARCLSPAERRVLVLTEWARSGSHRVQRCCLGGTLWNWQDRKLKTQTSRGKFEFEFKYFISCCFFPCRVGFSLTPQQRGNRRRWMV